MICRLPQDLFILFLPSLLRFLCLLAATSVLIAGCEKAPDDPVVRPPEPVPAPVPGPPAAPGSRPAPAMPSLSSPSSPSADSPAKRPVPAARGPSPQSEATIPRAYRKDGAAHLYRLNAERIYKGRLPPHLYAIGVINVEIDRAGRVTRLNWLRAPRHAPQVVAEIERSIRKAAPFPVPARMGKVVYTDTWLWHKSGRFQLDTLTEGQD